ncbi:MAG: oligosaccharide flippase family protein [Chloroflexi bacterium]|nr:oligosaccharide flippase family protein [Chloroflexota bacterium]
MTFDLLYSRLRARPALNGLLPAAHQLRDLAYLVGGNVLKLALGLGTSILIFRALGPGDAGRFTLALSILGLLSIIGEFGLRDAAVNYIARFSLPDPERAAAVARTFLAVKFFLSALATTSAILAAGFIASQFYPGLDLADLIRLGAFSLLMNGLLAFVVVVLQAQQRFGAISIIGVLQTVVRAAAILVLFLSQQINLFTLLLLESLVPLGVFIYSLRLIPRAFRAFRVPSFAHFSLLWHFAKWIAVAALASAIFLKLDILLLSFYRAPSEVGLYAAAFALVGKLDVVKNAVVTSAFPDACRRAEKSDLRLYVLPSLRLTALVSFSALPLFAVGGYLIEWLYGVEYRGAVAALYPLLVAFLIGLNAEPVAYVLYPLNKPRWIAASDMLQLGFSVVANLALIPAFGIAGAAWSVLLTRIVALGITFVLVRRFLWQ